MERHVEIDPSVAERHEGGFAGLTADANVRFRQLADALHFDQQALFDDHLGWLKVVHASRDWPTRDLDLSVQCMVDELADRMSPDPARPALAVLDAGRAYLATAPTEAPSHLEEPSPHSKLAQRYLLAVLEARRHDAVGLVVDAAESGVPIDELIREVVVRAQAEIGRMWQCGEVHIGEEHFATRVAQDVLARLRDHVPRHPSAGRRILLGSVRGDLHDMAGRLLEQAFEAAGFDTVLLGASIPESDVARSAIDFEADVIAVSAHLSDQVWAVEDLIRTLRQTPELAGRPVLVGGPPFDRVPGLWQQIGADGYAPTPGEAVEVVEQLLAR